VYKLEKQYVKKMLSKDVKDYFFDGQNLLYLNNYFLFTNILQCPVIALNKAYDHLSYSNGFVALSSGNNIDLYSLRYCGQLSIKKNKELSHFLLIYPFILYYGSREVSIEKVLENKEYLQLKLKNEIVNILPHNSDVIRIACSDGNIFFLNILKKKIIKIIHLDEPISYIWFWKGSIYFVNRKNEFKKYNINTREKIFIGELKNRILSVARNEPAMTMENKLHTYNREILLNKNFNNVTFDVVDNELIVCLEGRKLYILYIDKPRYVESVLFKSIDKNACLIDNNIYFKDLDNSYKSINLKTKEVRKINKYIDNCKSKVYLQNGYFVQGEHKLVKFANTVKENKGYRLFSRLIDGNYYFYLD
jgi:hypothetical protein